MKMGECRKDLIIGNIFGLHGRASALLVETAKQFAAEIRLIHNDAEGDCKSILDVLALACTKDATVTVWARGEDAEAAIAALSELVADKFGEE